MAGKWVPTSLTWMLFFSIISAFLGMVQFGFNTGVLNLPGDHIKNFIGARYNTTGEMLEASNDDTVTLIYSVTVSIFAIGGMIGAQIGGLLADKLGRKGGILVNNTLALLGGLLMALCKTAGSVEILIIGRLLIGVNCGINTVLIPLYLSEIAPVSLRGRLGTVNQLGVTIGLLLAQVLSLKSVLGDAINWPYLLGLSLVPPVLQLVSLPFCPESPRYLLITKNEEIKAIAALKRLRGGLSVVAEIDEMKSEFQKDSKEEKMTLIQVLKSTSLRIPLLVGVMMHLSQQLTGINAVFYYSGDLFKAAKLEGELPTIGVGIIMVLMTFVTIPLIDRLGRRTLHLSGLGGMFIFSIVVTLALYLKGTQEVQDAWSIIAVVSILGFVLFFAIGPGTIPWMITPELFSQGPRPAAISLVVAVNWLANFTVGLVFLPINAALKNAVFIPFSVLLVIFWVFTFFMLPETKNKTFEEISELFRKKQGTPSSPSKMQVEPASNASDPESCKNGQQDCKL